MSKLILFYFDKYEISLNIKMHRNIKGSLNLSKYKGSLNISTSYVDKNPKRLQHYLQLNKGSLS